MELMGCDSYPSDDGIYLVPPTGDHLSRYCFFSSFYMLCTFYSAIGAIVKTGSVGWAGLWMARLAVCAFQETAVYLSFHV